MHPTMVLDIERVARMSSSSFAVLDLFLTVNKLPKSTAHSSAPSSIYILHRKKSSTTILAGMSFVSALNSVP